MRPYTRWTNAEYKQLETLRALGWKKPELARKLHRTEGSIAGALGRLKVPHRPTSQQPALMRFLLSTPATRAEIFAAGFTLTPLKNLVTRGHVVGRSYPGFSHSRTYEVTNEGKRNLHSRYPNPRGSAED